ncbi:MAG: DUF2177 family protein [Alphaproteobacteria bacterium]|nr:DUF2177 family protein [Alphaproteobacteria bacterium]
MSRWAIGYGATAFAFLVLDGIWLSAAAPTLYRSALGPLLSQRIQALPAVAFYLIYVAGIVGLAVAPALAMTNPLAPVALGAGLGFVAYATYDLTNLATLAGWPARIAILDMGWGTIATALAALAGFLAMTHLAPLS